MPIYEYRCRSCGHELETLQKFSDPALTTCPSCRGETLVKRVSAAGFQLKGTGWYATDFKGGSKSTPTKEAKDNGGDAAAGDKSKPSGEAKSGESTTAAKSEAKDTGASTGSAATPST